MASYVLSAFCGHDSSAALARDGRVVAAISQERLDRIKHSNATGASIHDVEDGTEGFPHEAVAYCLDVAGVSPRDVDVFTTNFDGEPPSIGSEQVTYPSHHECHAAFGFYSSPADRAAILVMDYVGDTIWLGDRQFLGYERESAWLGDQAGLASVWRHLGTRGPGLFGLGNVYNQVAAYLFPGDFDCEGKLMALAAYGRPNEEIATSFFLHRDGMAYVRPSRLFGEEQDRPAFLADDLPHYSCELDWDALPPSPRAAGLITQFHCDLAYRLQVELEDAIVYMARNLRRVTGADHLVLSGGVALNCRANEAVRTRAGFSQVSVPVSPGDAGQAMGAAMLVGRANGVDRQPRRFAFGRSYGDDRIERALAGARDWLEYSRPEALARTCAGALAAGKIVGWFQGESETGPRALGARSILADPRDPMHIKRLNAEVKRRPWFHPVAPSVLESECSKWFEIEESPFMSFATKAREVTRLRAPGIVHADGSVRVHSVREALQPLYHRLIDEFRGMTDLPLVANTSLNSRGEPIVETPEEAVRCFHEVGLDGIAIGPFFAVPKS